MLHARIEKTTEPLTREENADDVLHGKDVENRLRAFDRKTQLKAKGKILCQLEMFDMKMLKYSFHETLSQLR